MVRVYANSLTIIRLLFIKHFITYITYIKDKHLSPFFTWLQNGIQYSTANYSNFCPFLENGKIH